MELVTCKTVTKVINGHKKTVQQCTTKLVSGPVKFTTQSVKATLSRAGKVYATGSATISHKGTPASLRLTPKRKISAGTYTLTLTENRRTTRTVITIR